MTPSVLCRRGGGTCPSVSLRIKLSTTVAKSSLLLEVARVRTLPPRLLLAVIVSSTCTSDEEVCTRMSCVAKTGVRWVSASTSSSLQQTQADLSLLDLAYARKRSTSISRRPSVVVGCTELLYLLAAERRVEQVHQGVEDLHVLGHSHHQAGHAVVRRPRHHFPHLDCAKYAKAKANFGKIAQNIRSQGLMRVVLTSCLQPFGTREQSLDASQMPRAYRVPTSAMLPSSGLRPSSLGRAYGGRSTAASKGKPKVKMQKNKNKIKTKVPCALLHLLGPEFTLQDVHHGVENLYSPIGSYHQHV